MSEAMEENGFHKPENLFSVARIRFVFKNWFPLISVTLSASKKNLSHRRFPQQRDNPSPIAGMKDSFKNTFPLDNKNAFTGRSRCFFRKENQRRWFQLEGNVFLLR